MGKSKSAAVEESSDDDDAESEFAVEYIEHVQLDPDNPKKWMYYTKWLGYPDNENTLQAEADMTNSLQLVEGFWRDVGVEKRDTKQYAPRYDLDMNIRSTPTWRQKQSASAKQIAAAEAQKKSVKQAKKREKKEQEKSKGKPTLQEQHKAKQKEKEKATPKGKKKEKAPTSTSSTNKKSRIANSSTASSSTKRPTSDKRREPSISTPSTSSSHLSTKTSVTKLTKVPSVVKNGKSRSPSDRKEPLHTTKPLRRVLSSSSSNGSSSKPPSKVTRRIVSPTPSETGSEPSSLSTELSDPKPIGPVAIGTPAAPLKDPTTVPKSISSMPTTPSVLQGFKPLQPLPPLNSNGPTVSVAPLKRKASPEEDPAELPARKVKKQHRGRVINSDNEEGDARDEETTGHESDASSSLTDRDPLFHDSQETTTSVHNDSNIPLNDDTVNSVTPSNKRVRRQNNTDGPSRSSSPDEPLASRSVSGSGAPPAPVSVDTGTKAFFRPLAQQAEKHRGSRVKIIDHPMVKRKNYGLPPKAQSSSSTTAVPTAKQPSLSEQTSTAPALPGHPLTVSPMQMDLSLPPPDFSIDPTTPLSPSTPISPSLYTSSVLPVASSKASILSSGPSRRKSAIEVTESMDASVQSDVPAPVKPKVPVIQKKWKGFICFKSLEMSLCEVQYEAKTGTSPLGAALRNMGSLVAEKQHDEGIFLPSIYPAFEPPIEFGVLSGVDLNDTRKLDKWVAYLEDLHRVILIRFETSRTAFILLYPSTLTNVNDTLGLKLPSSGNGKTQMVLAMLQKAVPRDFPDLSQIPRYPPEWVVGLRTTIGDHPFYQRTARYFGIEPALLEFLQDCPFSIYNTHSSRYPFVRNSLSSSGARKSAIDINVAPEEDIETRALVALLTRERGVGPGGLQSYRMDWRVHDPSPAPVMFIHANAWLHGTGDVPSFMQMRNRKIRFFRYGKPSAKTGLTGGDNHMIHEVFPRGTVLSFTADALVKDPIKSARIISAVGKTQIHGVYIHPHTIGLLEQILSEDWSNRCYVDFLIPQLRAFLQGASPPFCVTSCPPPTALRTSDPTGSADVRSRQTSDNGDDTVLSARLKYLQDQIDTSVKTWDVPELLFRKCHEDLAVAYPATSANTVTPETPSGTLSMADNHPKILAPTGAKNNPPTLIALTKLERLVAETCADDIARMQSLPEMYKSYREFVLVHGGRGRDEPKNLRKGEIKLISIDELEWDFDSTKTTGSPAWE